MDKQLFEKIKDRIIEKEKPVISALKQMDEIDKKLLFVVEGDTFISILSIGDIQRALIKNLSLDRPVKEILRKKVRLARESDPEDSIRQLMLQHRTECMPVVNSRGDLVNVYFWEDLFGEDVKRTVARLGLPVVIMAGGKGTRLQPLTHVLPKPLLPVGSKTILEHIMDRFRDVGCNDFYLSVNYKSDMIRYYFGSKESNEYNITFLEEEKPLGTAGSLHLLKGKIDSAFFVTNCDILIEQDYSEIHSYHTGEKNELTIVAALKHYPIPYGTIESGERGKLVSITEKPEFTLKINSGMYILEPSLLEEIPENQHFHITELIELINRKTGRVGVFPVSEKSWTDFGERKEYIKNLQ